MSHIVVNVFHVDCQFQHATHSTRKLSVSKDFVFLIKIYSSFEFQLQLISQKYVLFTFQRSKLTRLLFTVPVKCFCNRKWNLLCIDSKLPKPGYQLL